MAQPPAPAPSDDEARQAHDKPKAVAAAEDVMMEADAAAEQDAATSGDAQEEEWIKEDEVVLATGLVVLHTLKEKKWQLLGEALGRTPAEVEGHWMSARAKVERAKKHLKQLLNAQGKTAKPAAPPALEAEAPDSDDEPMVDANALPVAGHGLPAAAALDTLDTPWDKVDYGQRYQLSFLHYFAAMWSNQQHQPWPGALRHALACDTETRLEDGGHYYNEVARDAWEHFRQQVPEHLSNRKRSSLGLSKVPAPMQAPSRAMFVQRPTVEESDDHEDDDDEEDYEDDTHEVMPTGGTSTRPRAHTGSPGCLAHAAIALQSNVTTPGRQAAQAGVKRSAKARRQGGTGGEGGEGPPAPPCKRGRHGHVQPVAQGAVCSTQRARAHAPAVGSAGTFPCPAAGAARVGTGVTLPHSAAGIGGSKSRHRGARPPQPGGLHAPRHRNSVTQTATPAAAPELQPQRAQDTPAGHTPTAAHPLVGDTTMADARGLLESSWGLGTRAGTELLAGLGTLVTTATRPAQTGARLPAPPPTTHAQPDRRVPAWAAPVTSPQLPAGPSSPGFTGDPLAQDQPQQSLPPGTQQAPPQTQPTSSPSATQPQADADSPPAMPAHACLPQGHPGWGTGLTLSGLAAAEAAGLHMMATRSPADLATLTGSMPATLVLGSPPHPQPTDPAARAPVMAGARPTARGLMLGSPARTAAEGPPGGAVSAGRSGGVATGVAGGGVHRAAGPGGGCMQLVTTGIRQVTPLGAQQLGQDMALQLAGPPAARTTVPTLPAGPQYGGGNSAAQPAPSVPTVGFAGKPATSMALQLTGDTATQSFAEVLGHHITMAALTGAPPALPPTLASALGAGTAAAEHGAVITAPGSRGDTPNSSLAQLQMLGPVVHTGAALPTMHLAGVPAAALVQAAARALVGRADASGSAHAINQPSETHVTAAVGHVSRSPTPPAAGTLCPLPTPPHSTTSSTDATTTMNTAAANTTQP